MRKKLADKNEVRSRFRGVFQRYGRKAGWKGRSVETLLIKDIKNLAGEPVTDHLWFAMTRGFEALALKPGDAIEFDARVTEYTKGYVNRAAGINQQKKDYKLSRPTKVVKLT